MTDLIVNPSHAHGFDRFERIDGQVRAHCLCGSWWTGESKPAANRLLNRHISERAREFRKVRNALRKQAAEAQTVPSESEDQYVMEVP